MKVPWEESKRLTNLAKHGLDLADLDADFFATAMVSPAKGFVPSLSASIEPESSSRVAPSPWAWRPLRDFHAIGEQEGKEDVMPRKFSSRRPLTDAEEAEIQRMIASDPDNPELTDQQIAGLRPFAEVLPALAESAKRSPGRPKLEKTLEPVTLRLDPSVVAHFRAQGADWRKRMARVLAKAAT
jgi:uncharacterized protein (DUF4415 family)